LGLSILPNLLRYETLAVDDYGCMPHALHLRETRQSLNLGSTMKRTGKKHNQWHDHYTQQAKKERFPARSVYKLQEIQKKYNIIKKGNNVLDLGCAPGSWLLYSADLTGSTGRVIGIDLLPVTVNVPPHVRIYAGDILLMDDDFFKSPIYNWK